MCFYHLPGTEAEGYDCDMNLGMSEMIFLFIAALILVGPKKLPEIMRQVGKFMAEFKRASNEFKWQIETEMRNLELESERAKQTILPPAAPPIGTVANGAETLEAKPVAALTDGASDNGSGADASSSVPSPIPSDHVPSDHAATDTAATKSVDA